MSPYSTQAKLLKAIQLDHGDKDINLEVTTRYAIWKCFEGEGGMVDENGYWDQGTETVANMICEQLLEGAEGFDEDAMWHIQECIIDYLEDNVKVGVGTAAGREPTYSLLTELDLAVTA